MRNDFLKEIENGVIKLSRKKGILFSVVNCERLLFNYVSFQKKNNWGDHRILQDSIDMIYQYLINENVFDSDDFSKQLEMIDSATPHTEAFPGILTSFALDACTSIHGTLLFILDNDVERVMDIVSYAYDTVDMFIQEKENINSNDKQIENKIWNDSFMKNAIRSQHELLFRISKLENDTITDEIINGLKIEQRIIDLTILN